MPSLNRVLVCCGLLGAATAAADTAAERPMQLEVGLNTRHFAATAAQQGVAFRTTTGASTTPELPEGTALTTSLRFTGRTLFNTFLGVEGEVGEMVGRTGSNVAGAYGVAGVRSDLGALRIAAEVVAGRRWVRYALDGTEDPTLLMVEPRVRADIWLASQLTLGVAAGATLGERSVWMAGVYVGFHSQPYAGMR